MLRAGALGSVGLLAVAACGSPSMPPPAGTCVEDLRTDCSPLYDPPTYSTIFQKILQPTCAQGTGTCHTSDGAMANLVFEDADDAYARLLGEVDGRPRVNPGDPACSLLVERLEARDPNVRMPPGPTPLSDAARCDVVRWIAEGAQR